MKTICTEIVRTKITCSTIVRMITICMNLSKPTVWISIIVRMNNTKSCEVKKKNHLYKSRIRPYNYLFISETQMCQPSQRYQFPFFNIKHHDPVLLPTWTNFFIVSGLTFNSMCYASCCWRILIPLRRVFQETFEKLSSIVFDKGKCLILNVSASWARSR